MVMDPLDSRNDPVRDLEATPADPLLHAANTTFNVDYLFPYQRLVVSNVLEGRNQIVVLPTGAGKSFCFLLPAALLQGLTIIVYPLRSLIADQARRLSTGDIKAESLTGETPKADRPALYQRCKTGETKILLTNPEMLIQPKVREALEECDISHLVIDEAHVLPEWGKSFRPAYLEFAQTAGELGAHIMSAFTATASPVILEGLEKHLFRDGPPHRVLGIPDRPNIHYSVRPALSVRHEMYRIATTEARPLLIFCRSRASAELTAQTLRSDTGASCIRFYHAGLEPEEKSDIEAWFFDADDAILASTCAYGMGVDKSNIRTVVHGEAPESVEAYLQETGRAGRDGNPSRAIALAPMGTVGKKRKERVDDLGENRGAQMRAYLETVSECRRRYLLDLLGAHDVECTGCDVCDGTASKDAEHEWWSRKFFHRNAHRYNRAEATAALRAQLSDREKFRWTNTEASEAIETLIELGIVGPPKTWIGKAVYRDRLVLLR